MNKRHLATVIFSTVTLVIVIIGIAMRLSAQTPADIPPAEVLLVRAFDGSRWIAYRQGNREYSIRISEVQAISEATDKSSCYFHLPGNTFRVDVPFSKLDAMMQEEPDGNDDN